jgi:hypothetical protein|tara:strand:- start:59 stop:682 length:624 start_codon:yes stop_codon:yes gene_type:complete
MPDFSVFALGKSLLLRHAEKESVSKAYSEPELSLTPKGNRDAVKFGELLHLLGFEEKLRFFASPRKRCIQTANHIAKGAGLSSPSISTSKYLGSPGPYVINKEVGQEVFSSSPPEEIVKKYMMGDRQGCFTPLELGSQELYDFIKSESEPNLVSIFISHDAIIIPFIYWLESINLGESWLPPLGGISISDEMNVLFSSPLEVLSSQS